MKLDVDLVKFEARVFDAEQILYYDVNIFNMNFIYFLSFFQRSIRYNYNEAGNIQIFNRI